MNQIYSTKIAIIGGGAAGIMAAYSSSLNENAQIHLFERNDKLGKKIFITGKGRCNVTNSGEPQDFFDALTNNEKFFYSAFYTFDNFALMTLLGQTGLKLKSERGNRVFPESDKSSDVIKALKTLISKDNIEVFLNAKVEWIRKKKEKFLISSNNFEYDKVIIAGGGKSYPVTGSDGYSYELAKNFGHTVTELSPGLCGMNTVDSDTHGLSGLSLKNVVFNVSDNGKKIYSQLGEMEFTHYGVSGPIILSASSLIKTSRFKDYIFSIDLKSGLNEKKLESRILRDIDDEPNKEIKNTLGKLLPYRLMDVVFSRSGVSDNRVGNQLSKDERQSIIHILKDFRITPVSLRPFDEAIITRGGVSCSEINPSTMESKIVEGLYFAGEVIDLDALTGGFNLQLAFSTGYLAGMSAAGEV